MNYLKLALLLLIGAATQSSLYSMNHGQRPSTGKGLEVCISGLLRNPGDDTPEAMWNIIKTSMLDESLMNDYARISACVHYIKRAFWHQNIAQISQQPRLTQYIADALRYTYEFLDDDTIRHHAQNIARQLRQTTTKIRTKRVDRPESPCSESEESMSKKQCTKTEEATATAQTTSSIVPFYQQPWLMSHMAEFLSLKDRFQLACASKDTRLSLQQSNKLEHFRTFMREVANPIDYIIHKAQGNPNVSIDGIIYSTQEVLDFLYANIAEILINNVYDPIVYVLEQAQGSSTVEIYGKSFDTNQLIKELYKLGADVNRVYNRTLEHCIDLCNYNAGEDIHLPHRLEKIEIAQDIYDSLDAEQQLDLAQWHIVEYRAPAIPGNFWEAPEEHIQEINTLYLGLITQCESIAQNYPNDGIVIEMPLSIDNIIITEELIRNLSRFNIVSLIIECDVKFPNGMHHLAQLQHLRELYIFDIFDSAEEVNAFPSELCTMVQLRSLAIHADRSNKSEITIPAQIESLKKLRFLDLRELYLDQLPAEIGELEQLRLLAFDKVETLTPEIATLKNLILYQGTWEQTDTNKILARQCLSRLKKLQKIYIFDNFQLEDLGEEIKHLLALQLVYSNHWAYGGEMKHIPNNIEFLPSLKKLTIYGVNNPTISFTLLRYIAANNITFCLSTFDDLEALRNIIALRDYIEVHESLGKIILESNNDLSTQTKTTQVAALLLQESITPSQLKLIAEHYKDIKSYIEFFVNIWR